jgi:predicted PurR-regulated permease PerM
MAQRTPCAKLSKALAGAMDRSAKTALWIIAAGIIVAGLYWFREILTQFALAMVLWLAINALTRLLDERIPLMPRWLALPIALCLVIAMIAAVSWVIVANVNDLGAQAGAFRARINALAADIHGALGLSGAPPTFDALLARANPSALLRQIASGLQGVIGDFVFILIYLGFIFSAAATFSFKLDAIFPNEARRAQAQKVFTDIRTAMESYLWVQTLLSLLISALTYATLLAIGLPQPLFWAFLIFFLNYIPTIGSLIAAVLPTLFAIVHFETWEPIALTFVGVSAWQFAVGNFLQPRLTGKSLNLSALVVLLSLAFWGSLWGIAGAFLSAPLTVMVMIILAQFSATRWIAILLSENGRPLAPSAKQKAPIG